MNDAQGPDSGLSNHQLHQKMVERLDEIRIENQRLVSRNTLIVTGGAFTISITLLKDLYQSPLGWTNWFLIASWVLFGFCALAQIYADHLSSSAVEVQREIIDDYYLKDDDSALQRRNAPDIWVSRINQVSIWVLFSGLICMLIFGAFNFLNKQENAMDKKPKTAAIEQNKKDAEDPKRGVTMPKPIEKKDNPADKNPKPKSK